MTIRHGQLYLRDHIPPRSRYYANGRFGRLFPTLPPFARDDLEIRKALMELGKPGGIMDPGGDENPDNPQIPAGFTFLGQFLDHDITFDPTSSLERQNDPESISNFPTPAFELDSVYGSGRSASPRLYDQTTSSCLSAPDATECVAFDGLTSSERKSPLSLRKSGEPAYHNRQAQ